MTGDLENTIKDLSNIQTPAGTNITHSDISNRKRRKRDRGGQTPPTLNFPPKRDDPRTTDETMINLLNFRLTKRADRGGQSDTTGSKVDTSGKPI
ncbi:hypothetical protein Tco_0630094 [Tanacetum coccineum]